MKRPIDRYVDSLLRRRRPKPFPPTEDDVAVARVAIELAAAAPEAQRPREAFVEDLRRRLAEQQNAAEPAAEQTPAYRRQGRRGFLAATGAAAAAAATAVGVDHAVSGFGSPALADGDDELSPTTGSWQTVAASADLPEGTVLPFDLGAVSGFVRRVSGRVQAVSGVCTHQGCRLYLDDPGDRLACPCHGATFTLAGAPLAHPHSTRPLPALPRLAVRVDAEGHVQVYAPSPGMPRDTAGK